MQISAPRPSRLTALWFTLALLALGTVGGELAKLAGLPLPWMIGSLLTSAAFVGLLPARVPKGYRFSQPFRMCFIAVIGALIGSQVNAELLSQWRTMVPSLLGVTVFVVLSHGASYVLFRKLGGFDRITAFFCAAPGGLMESIALGEQYGADIPTLTLQQFLRVILVVSTVPLGLSIAHGQALGSSSGLTFGHGAPDLGSIPVLLVVGGLGLALGRMIRLPAGQLTGPMIVAAAATTLGLVDLSPPGWVLAVAQVVIGVSLGVRFIGVTGRMLRMAFGLSVLSVGAMLAIGVTLAVLLHPVSGQPTEVLILSFAPGGVSEMGLVALSLSANPAVVAFHHLYRIIITVLEMSFLGRWIAARHKS